VSSSFCKRPQVVYADFQYLYLEPICRDAKDYPQGLALQEKSTAQSKVLRATYSCTRPVKKYASQLCLTSGRIVKPISAAICIYI